MMKILHTSDWHLGHLLYDYDRTEEHRDFLSQLADIVREEKPDVMVVSGDVFHYSNPSVSSQRLFTDALLAIHEACPAMQTVVVAGNHDSSSRLEIAANLWHYAGVTVIGHIAKTDGAVDLERHIVEVKGAGGERKGYVVAVPHVFPQNFPALSDDIAREDRQRLFFQTLLDRVAEHNTEELPVVLMAHLAVTGSNVTGHDESRRGMEYTELRMMGEGYDYLALGHIHCPQTLSGGHARYCGTPIAVSFDETYPHSVSIVEIAAHGSIPAVRTIPVTTSWPLKVIPREAVPLDEALKMLEDISDEEQSYVELHVQLKDVPPAYCMERASRITRGKRCRFCRYKWERILEEKVLPEDTLDVGKLQTLSPPEVAAIYYRDKYGQNMDDVLLKMLDEVMARVGRKD